MTHLIDLTPRLGTDDAGDEYTYWEIAFDTTEVPTPIRGETRGEALRKLADTLDDATTPPTTPTND